MYSDDVYEGHKLGFLKYFDSVLDSLRKKFDVKEIWVGAGGGSHSKIYEDGNPFYNIFSFKNGNDVLEGLNPDLVMVPDSQDYLSRSLLYATKFRSIPSVILYSATPYYIKTSVQEQSSYGCFSFVLVVNCLLKNIFF